MTTQTLDTRSGSCSPAGRVTRSLLGYGVITGPIYVAVSLTQALTRQGFDITTHAWSLLVNGDLGWIQVTNFIVAGLMTIVFAVGLRRAGAGRWAPRLVGAYGASLVGAGIFRADPAQGFPVGTPANANTISWHGMLHFMCGGVGFLCLIAACLIVARGFAREGNRGWAAYSRITGVVFLAAFIGIASGSHGALTTLPFVAAVVLVYSWITALSVRLYRQTA